MGEFFTIYEGVAMNGPGDGLPANELVVEEELIDNQETETPASGTNDYQSNNIINDQSNTL